MAAIMTPLAMRRDTALPRPYVSPADTLPSVDFDFNGLRERMAVFTAKFDAFIARGRQQVLDERNAFRLSIAELQDSQRNHRAELGSLSSAAVAHKETLAREEAETAELEAAVATYNGERDAALARRDALAESVARLQAELGSRRAALDAQTRHLEGQARQNGPEVRFWEDSLGLRIEGAGSPERIRFAFACVDDRAPEREVEFVLDMGGAYRVEETRPVLEAEEVEAVVERLGDGGDLAGFLKGMRALFVQAVKEK